MKNVKDALKEDKVQKIFAENTSNMLFPKGFDELLKTEKGSRSKKKEGTKSATSTSGSATTKQLGPKDVDSCPESPFRLAPPTIREWVTNQRNDDNRGNNGPRYNNRVGVGLLG
jgi:hypothetical protein